MKANRAAGAKIHRHLLSKTEGRKKASSTPAAASSCYCTLTLWATTALWITDLDDIKHLLVQQSY